MVLISALVAGTLSGVFLTAVQQFQVTPLILETEIYESAAEDEATHSHSAKHALMWSNEFGHLNGIN